MLDGNNRSLGGIIEVFLCHGHEAVMFYANSNNYHVFRAEMLFPVTMKDFMISIPLSSHGMKYLQVRICHSSGMTIWSVRTIHCTMKKLLVTVIPKTILPWQN